MPSPHNIFSFGNQIRQVPFQSEETETIPPYAALEVSNQLSLPRGGYLLKAKKPTVTDVNRIAFNGPAPVGSMGYGRLTQDFPAVAQVASMASISLGQEIGPQIDSYLLSVDGTGFAAITARKTRSGVETTLVNKVAEVVAGVRYRNNHATDVPARGMVAIYGHATVDGEFVYEGTQPSSSVPIPLFYLVNSESTLANGDIGTGTRDSFETVLAEVNVDAGDYIGPVPGDWRATRAGGLFSVVGPRDVDELAKCYRLDEGHEVAGKNRDAIQPNNDTAIFEVWRNGADTTKEIKNVYMDWMHNSQSLPADTECIARWFGRDVRWRIVQASCPEA